MPTTEININSNKPLKRQIAAWIDLVKLEHTIFALPFALSGFILASKGLPDAYSLIWTIVAFTGARTAAMSLNRIIDAEIDSRNPRTQFRAIPQGTIKKNNALALAIMAFILLLIAASHLPPLCLQLSPIAIIWLSLYSYSKRFTAACHLALGIALGGAALGGWIAAGGSLMNPCAWLLSAAVTLWVTGFDIIYACQDYDFDKKEHIFSLPSQIGIAKSLQISRLAHLFTILSLVLLGLSGQLGLYYWLGIIVITSLLFYEQTLVNDQDLSRLNTAFFNTNGIISILAFSFILIDHLSK